MSGIEIGIEQQVREHVEAIKRAIVSTKNNIESNNRKNLEISFKALLDQTTAISRLNETHSLNLEYHLSAIQKHLIFINKNPSQNIWRLNEIVECTAALIKTTQIAVSPAAAEVKKLISACDDYLSTVAKKWLPEWSHADGVAEIRAFKTALNNFMLDPSTWTSKKTECLIGDLEFLRIKKGLRAQHFQPLLKTVNWGIIFSLLSSLGIKQADIERQGSLGLMWEQSCNVRFGQS